MLSRGTVLSRYKALSKLPKEGRRLRAATGLLAVLSTAFFVLPASAAELPFSGNLDLSSSAEVKIGPPTQREYKALWTTAPAGDVNGDGLQDFMVGSDLIDNRPATTRSSVYVVFGDANRYGASANVATIDLNQLASRGFRIDAAADGDDVGRAMAPAGDVNGDGKGDLLIGARGADTAGRVDAGTVYVIYGRSSSSTINLASLSAGDGYKIIGGSLNEEAGFSVASIGDLNGDKVPETVVGAPGSRGQAQRDNSGSVYVVFGRRLGGDVDTGSLGAAGYRIDGDYGRAGESVDGVGDMSGDGLPEVVIGAPEYATPEARQGQKPLKVGAAYVVWGKAGTARIDLASLDSNGFAVAGNPSGPKKGGQLGHSVAGLSDINGDGKPDVALGEPFADYNKRVGSGAVYAIYGKADAGGVAITQLNSSQGLRIGGLGIDDRTGYVVSNFGDFNGDGNSDFLIGAYLGDSLARAKSGAVFVVYGGKEAVQAITGAKPSDGSGIPTLDLASMRGKGVLISGPAAEARVGSGIANAGDTDGDKASDIVIGSAYPTNAPGWTNQPAYVVYGPSSRQSGQPPRNKLPIALPADPGAAKEKQIDHCTAVENVEAVIDDSGSMSETDPDTLTAKALQLMLSKPRNVGDILGAVEFGSQVDPLFAPLQLGSEETADAMKNVKKLIGADNGSTDYNAAFESLANNNPGALARIFLTDGEHNVDEYVEGHRGGPPVYVIGLGSDISEEADKRLQRIAKETKGQYFPRVDAETIQSVLNKIDAKLNCDIGLETAKDTLTKKNSSETHTEHLKAGTKSADVTISWDNPKVDVAVAQVEVLKGGNVLRRFSARAIANAASLDLSRADQAKAAASSALLKKIKRWRATRLVASKGPTYLTLRVRGIKKGSRLRVRVKGRKLGKRRITRKTKVFVQFGQSRRVL